MQHVSELEKEHAYSANMATNITADVGTVTVIVKNIEGVRWRLNQEKVLLLSPVIVYVVMAIVAGLIGNILVCYVYHFRLRRSPSRYFIVFLAVLDLLSCCVGSGSEITDLLQPYTFTATWSCKLLRFGLSFTIIAASFTLICVAFDRYYKVCRPMNGFPVRKVKYLCLTVVLLSLLFASPAIAIFGLKTVETEVRGVTGTECSTADHMRNTPLPIVYYSILFLAFLILFTCFSLLYIRIGIELWRRKKLTIGETLPAYMCELKNGKIYKNVNTPTDEVSGPSYPSEDDSKAYCDNPAREDSVISGTPVKLVGIEANGANETDTLRNVHKRLVRQRSRLGKMSIRTVRTTGIFFAVSVAFVISFLPYLIANILKFSKIAFHEFSSEGEEVVYNFCVRSFFISNFINPIIYSALNRNFRRECKKLFKRIIRKLTKCCQVRHTIV